MKLNGKLFALVAVFAALGVAAGTGAFTTVSAERTASVGVSGDASAALGLDVGDADYASLNNGELEITFDNVNTNAATTVESLFTITNNGDSAVTVNLDKSPSAGPDNNADAVDFGVDGDVLADGTSPVADYVGIADGTQVSIVSGSIRIGSGDQITVGMYLDTSDKDPRNGVNYDVDPVEKDEQIIDSITISAEAGTSADYLYDGNSDGTADVSQP